MPDMASSHEKIALTNHRRFIQSIGTMHRDMFPKDIPCSDLQTGRRIPILEILRSITDDAPCVESISRPNRCVTGQVNLWPDFTAFSKFHMSIDDSVGTDPHVCRESGGRMNDRRWVNETGFHVLNHQH